MIEELAHHETALGELTLRRRLEPRLDNVEIYEVKLGNEYLMSSLFTEGERQLAHLGLAGLSADLDVVVGGLGLGYTAAAVLENSAVRSLLVIDLFQEVIDWHTSGTVPVGPSLTADPRCELRQGDFVQLARTGLDVSETSRLFDAVLVDIDHSPRHFLDGNNESFYNADGLNSLQRQIKPGGSFALWSNDPVDDEFLELLKEAFGSAAGHNVEFPNPYTGAASVNSVYVARSLQ
jgi:spermidine synthase